MVQGDSDQDISFVHRDLILSQLNALNLKPSISIPRYSSAKSASAQIRSPTWDSDARGIGLKRDFSLQSESLGPRCNVPSI